MDEVTARIRSAFVGDNPKPPLPLTQVAEGMSRCYANASELLDDARLLARSDKLARTAALTVLALEETGKVIDLAMTFVRALVEQDDRQWGAFWERFVRHSKKQQLIGDLGKRSRAAVGQYDTFIRNPLPYLEFLPDDVGSLLDVLKQRCFYVDYVASGFVLPSSRTADLALIADRLFAFAEERVDSLAFVGITARRSLAFVERNAALSLKPEGPAGSVAPVAGVTHAQAATGGQNPDADAIELRADLRSLLSHRTSSLVPDYLTAYSALAAVFRGLPMPTVEQTFRAECEMLQKRAEVTQLPMSCFRATGMLKIAFGYLSNQPGG